VTREGEPYSLSADAAVADRGECALLHANEVVSADRLVDDLWPSGAPASVRSSDERTSNRSSHRGLLVARRSRSVVWDRLAAR